LASSSSRAEVSETNHGFGCSEAFCALATEFIATADSGSEPVFRPAFSDSVTQCPPLPQNTIAAYLLRNSVDVGGVTIFDALKNDALAKAAAARAVIDGELSKFQDAFDTRYGK
jgi:hypothetical protein